MHISKDLRFVNAYTSFDGIGPILPAWRMITLGITASKLGKNEIFKGSKWEKAKAGEGGTFHS